MYTEIIPPIQDDSRFKGVERTHSTYSDDKWIIITTKASKDALTLFIDNLIEKSNVPTFNPNKRSGHSTKYNVNSTLVSYAVMIQQNTEPTENTKYNFFLQFKKGFPNIIRPYLEYRFSLLP